MVRPGGPLRLEKEREVVYTLQDESAVTKVLRNWLLLSKSTRDPPGRFWEHQALNVPRSYPPYS